VSERTRVLVVIPTLNEASHIQAVLAGILADADSTPDLTTNVVVVDGGSTDGTCQLVEQVAARRPGLELLHNRAKIQSAAVNLAVRRFGHTADVLVRVDAHADYPEGYCSRLVHTLQRVGAHSVVVPMDSRGDGGVQLAVALLSNSPLGTGGSAHRAGHSSGFVDHGHHAAFQVDFFRRVGGYDEGFTHNEDAEFDCRQRALGARIYLDSDIRVGYRPRSTLAALWRQYFKYGAGRSRTVRRHPSSLRLRQLAVPAHLLLCLVALALSPISIWFLLWPAFYVLVLTVFSIKLAVQHRTAAGLLAGRAAFTMHMAWACGFFSGLISHRERIWQREMTVPLPVGEGS
jgi:succinoglycan biosynthesis protein ExoA